MKNSPSVLTLLSQYYKYIYREMQIQVPNQVPQLIFTRDILMGCFITSGSQSHSSGSALKVKHDFVFCNLSAGGIAVV